MIKDNPNLTKVLTMIKKGDKVLDVGGWAGTLNRATHVVDINPYKTRNKIHQFGDREYYSEDTWIVKDICDKAPLPFPDNAFDFVVCSHTLEDIRDPIWVCSEMKRVAKRGYLEFPSPKYELSRGVEGIDGMSYVGNAHHRWVIFVEGNKVKFLQKHHFVNGQSRYSVPYSHYKQMRPEEKISYIFFDKDFEFEEMEMWDERVLKDYFENLIRDFNCRGNFFWKCVEMKKQYISLGVIVKAMLRKHVEDAVSEPEDKQ